jgi:hypothetical protein
VAGVAAFIGFLFFRGYRLPDEVTPGSVREAGLAVEELPSAPDLQ